MARIRRVLLVGFLALHGTMFSGLRVAESDDEQPKTPPGSLPRYSLQVGQELHYDALTSTKYQGGQRRSAVDWKLWVVGANSDGSWRVLLRKASWYGTDDATPDKPDERRAELAWFDLFSDGRFTSNSSLGVLIDPRQLLPRLPANDAELAKGWTDNGAMDQKHEYQAKADKGDDGKLAIDDVRTSPMDEIYLSTSQTTYHFDVGRGLIDHADLALTQGFGIVGEGTGKITLIGQEMHGAGWAETLRGQMEAYFEADRQYSELMEQAEKEATRIDALLDQARDVAQQIAKKVTDPILKAQVAQLVENHESMAKYAREEAERKAKVLGKEAPAFQVTDLDDRPRSLTDYHGRVVVLDFWYRGCGWCIRAMPQINEVAESFRDRPVSVLGMNIDENVDDARFVVEKLGLTYTNLKATGVPQKYQVRGYPTLMVIDQQGVVRDVHVGYSPTLRSSLTATIDRLLAESGEAAKK